MVPGDSQNTSQWLQTVKKQRNKKSISGNGTIRTISLISLASDDILRSYGAKWPVCANWTLFTALLPVIQSHKQTVQNDVRFMNKSFFWASSFLWTSWTSSRVWTEPFETVCESSKIDLQVTQSNLTFQTPYGRWDSAWAKIPVYLILFMNKLI